MNKIFSTGQAIKESEKIRNTGKRIVLVGGCFDVLHIGHIHFLQKAKEQADILMVLLESDEKVKKWKGNNRPLFPQQERAEVLASLYFVDYVICLPPLDDNSAYDKMILALKPAIIATTQGDPARVHKDRQAKLLGIPVVEVIDRMKNRSTTKLAEMLEKEL
ncbi:MAG TPA: adenylyltransferase/cytidyltransferase family protein [Patescibacteria group bacterium]|nr:adenylyltransferase/cytidyltransferase family protein [Patescibacteria group bacterium]